MNTQFERKTGFYSKTGIEDVIEFQFNTNISLKDKMEIIINTVESVIKDDIYMSVAKDIFFKYFVLKNITDIDFSYIDESPEKIVLIEEFISNTTAFEIIKANTGDLIDSLYRSLSHAITSRTGVKEEQNNFVASLAQLVNLIIDKVGNFDVSSVMDSVQKLSGIAEGLDGNLNADNIVDAFFKKKIESENE